MEMFLSLCFLSYELESISSKKFGAFLKQVVVISQHLTMIFGSSTLDLSKTAAILPFPFRDLRPAPPLPSHGDVPHPVLDQSLEYWEP